ILAREIAQRLRVELAKRSLFPEIHVWATRLEEKAGRWTGRTVGQPMFGKTKAIAVWWLAGQWNLSLDECSGYGERGSEQWMLASVGKPVAVNPDTGLGIVARSQRWKIVAWRKEIAREIRHRKMVPERAR